MCKLQARIVLNFNVSLCHCRGYCGNNPKKTIICNDVIKQRSSEWIWHLYVTKYYHYSRIPMQRAVDLKHIHVVKYLFENGARTTGKDGLLIMLASLSHFDSLRYLCENGVDVDFPQYGVSLLQRTMLNGKHDMAKYLVEHGANVSWALQEWEQHDNYFKIKKYYDNFVHFRDNILPQITNHKSNFQ